MAGNHTYFTLSGYRVTIYFSSFFKAMILQKHLQKFKKHQLTQRFNTWKYRKLISWENPIFKPAAV